MVSEQIRGLVDLSRMRQALLSVAQPGLGALLAAQRMPSARTLVLGVVAASAGYLAVFSLNDVFDRDSDVEALEAGKGEFEGFDLDTAFERHPLAVGRLRHGIAVAWVASLAAIAILGAWMLNPWCVVLFGASVSLEWAYCSLRSRTWTKTLVSGVMVGIGGLAGWVAVAQISHRAAGFFVFLAAWEIAGRNIPNDLADLRADSAVGLRTVPTTFGPLVAGRAVAAGSAFTIASMPALGLAPVSLAFAFVAGVVFMTLPSLPLLTTPTPANAAQYFNRASLLPAVVFLVVFATFAIGGAA